MRLHNASEEVDADVRSLLKERALSLDRGMALARPIVESVRCEGDTAVLRYAKKLDGFSGKSFVVSEAEIIEATSRVPKRLMSALRKSYRRIEAYHSRQNLSSFEFRDQCGVFGQMVVPLGRVGIYAPGGMASYASSVLMAAVPARLAGVEEIALATPSRDGRIDDVVLAAARISGVDEVYSVGGAHAIAAMAYGTDSVRAVDKIVGPGGTVVTAAKLLVRDDCDIDFLAGPSEVLIIADGSANPEMVALEMMAQLEHDEQAVAVLVSPSDALLKSAASALSTAMEGAERERVIRAAAENGAVFVKARSMAQAASISNRFAPEHLLIATKNPQKQLKAVRNAGSVFVGLTSAVAFGDYCSGTNHILPTMGAAKSRSSLSVYDFMKIIPYQNISGEGAEQLAPVVAAVARAENLPNHALAAEARATKRSGGAK